MFAKILKSLSQERNQRLDYIDALKGVCILFVVFTHMKWSDADRLLLGFPFWIAMAVPIFMILSGFLYSKVFERSESDSLAFFFMPKVIIPSLVRFALPFLLIFPFEIRWAFKHGEVANLLDCISGFISGGYGPSPQIFLP
jgi:fucose 4-O-acetylase-like acetyltransferase